MSSPGGLVPSLLHHLAEHLSPLLPAPYSLVTNGLDVSLVQIVGGRVKVVTSDHIYGTAAGDKAGVVALCERVLGDMQDFVAYALRTAWPVDTTGRVLHPWAELTETHVAMGFRRDEVNGPEIAPFPVPDDPGRVIVAG